MLKKQGQELKNYTKKDILHPDQLLFHGPEKRKERKKEDKDQVNIHAPPGVIGLEVIWNPGG